MNSDGQKVILLCDDEILMRQVAGKMLARAGYGVLTAASGEEAEQIFHRDFRVIDLVLMDLSMPEESGLAVFRRLKSFDSKVKVLFSSGFQNDERLEAALNEGALGVLNKPYTMEKLLRMVSSFI